jgi:glycosyltransferase involved in cell wall biosynthesis
MDISDTPHTEETAGASSPQKKLLIVGPLPPPIGGSPLTLVVMLEELKSYPEIQVTVINTSPSTHVSKKMTGFNFEKVKRMFTILAKYRREIRDCNAILVFANDLFAFILVPLLLWKARFKKKPFYLKPVGSGIDLFMESHGKLVKSLMLKVLRSADGIFSQTQYLNEWLRKEGCKNSYYLPGFRSYHPVQPVQHQPNEDMRLIFFAHITRLKGPLILLEALQIIAQRGGPRVYCDFYGPIHDDIQNEFNKAREITPFVNYKGIADVGKATEIISEYDILVLPTCYDTEGHPGVLIEAMHARVPIISTQIRTLPELVKHGINGLLVPVGDSLALADAIEQLALDCELRKKMGEANFQMGLEFRSDVVIKKMVSYIFPDKP